jgi:hypothetical protein
MLALSDTHLCYKSDSAYIGCVARDGSELKPFAYPETTATSASTSSLWTDSGRLMFVWAPTSGAWRLSVCSLASCDTSITPIGEDGTQHAAVDYVRHRFFWRQSDGFWTVPATGNVVPTKVPVTAVPTDAPRPMTYRNGNLYFSGDSAIYRLPISDTGTPTTPVVVASPPTTGSYGNSMAANDGMLFWIVGTSIRSAPLPNGIGGGSNAVVDGAGAVAADNRALYWTANGAVQTCEIDNCPATRRSLPAPEGAAFNVVVDDVSVYWMSGTFIDDGQGGSRAAAKLWRLAK